MLSLKFETTLPLLNNAILYLLIFSPVEHPLEAEREYQRALNAVKLDNVFAKPFLGSLDGHRDMLSCLCKHPSKLSSIASASADGEVRLWTSSAIDASLDGVSDS